MVHGPNYIGLAVHNYYGTTLGFYHILSLKLHIWHKQQLLIDDIHTVLANVKYICTRFINKSVLQQVQIYFVFTNNVHTCVLYLSCNVKMSAKPEKRGSNCFQW